MKETNTPSWYIAWLVLALLVAVALGRQEWIGFYRLYRHGAAAPGLLLSGPNPQYGNAITYSFAVGSQTYTTSRTYLGSGLQPGTPGSSITVFYLPENPQVSCVGDPKGWLENETVAIGFAVLLLPTFAIMIVRWQYGRYQRRKAKAG
jgi:DNA-binding transcriptional regulator of glucitol operon